MGCPSGISYVVVVGTMTSCAHLQSILFKSSTQSAQKCCCTCIWPRMQVIAVSRQRNARSLFERLGNHDFTGGLGGGGGGGGPKDDSAATRQQTSKVANLLLPLHKLLSGKTKSQVLARRLYAFYKTNVTMSTNKGPVLIYPLSKCSHCRTPQPL